MSASQTAVISKRHRKIVVPHTPALAALCNQPVVFPLNGAPYMALPHDVEHVRLAQNFGIHAAPPILTYYRWPGNTQPFEAQRLSAAMLSMEKRAYVLNGMGTGKTRTVLWAYDWLRTENEVDRMLVVAPLSTLNLTWMREVFATIPHRRAVVLYGSREKRLRMLDTEADIYIINHDGVKTIMPELISRRDINLIVLDELAQYRNGTADRFKQMRRILETKERAWGLTGSPTPNEPTDAWAQARLITPWTAPNSFVRFRDDVMLKVSNFKWAAKPSALKTVQDMLRPSVRFTLEDVVELPETIIRTVEVPMGKRQKEVYEQLAKHMRAMFERDELTVMNSAILMNKLLQVAQGWVYTNARGIETLDNEDRLQTLHDTIESTERKVIVFIPFIHALDGVKSFLDGKKVDCQVVSGDTPKGKRDQIFSQFQNGLDLKVLVAHPQCMAHGLTLTAADTVIWFGPFASLEVFEQANARISRVGQKHKQQVILFEGSEVEKRLYKRLRTKQSVQDTLLDMMRAGTLKDTANG
jgi:SNF2 family DNA or RNA helicase